MGGHPNAPSRSSRRREAVEVPLIRQCCSFLFLTVSIEYLCVPALTLLLPNELIAGMRRTLVGVFPFTHLICIELPWF